MSILFGRDRTVIGRHIRNIFAEGELQEDVVCAKNAHTTQHGAIKDKKQIVDIQYYNLDVIISVGYRVKSRQGTMFRQWANSVLKEYILKGYAIKQRFERIEHRVTETEKKIDFFSKMEIKAEQILAVYPVNRMPVKKFEPRAKRQRDYAHGSISMALEYFLQTNGFNSQDDLRFIDEMYTIFYILYSLRIKGDYKKNVISKNNLKKAIVRAEMFINELKKYDR